MTSQQRAVVDDNHGVLDSESASTGIRHKAERSFSYLRNLVATELSRITRYADEVIQWKRLPQDDGDLLRLMRCANKRNVPDGVEFPDLSKEKSDRTVVLLHGTLNHHFDIEGLLSELRRKLTRGARVAVVLYNPYLRTLYQSANALGLRRGPMPTTFLTATDLDNIAKLAGYQVARIRPVGYFPGNAFGFGNLANRALACIPGIRHFGVVSVVLLRPCGFPKTQPSLSIVIPARNEKGNIENALKQLRYLNETIDLEVIYVEGHSSDGTWEEIERVVNAYGEEFKLQAFRQSGKGKNDAVRLGFRNAKHELLTILDADLTMPPSMLKRFYDAYCADLGDFINGSRLVYPMEGDAMRFLNRLGNVFFAKALSGVLDNRLGDSLCGTKLVSRRDYERIVAWRNDFGDFDPFGDFELLFPASVLGLGTVDVPVRYLTRTYGSTNISRFRHGLELLRMTAVGLVRVRSGSR
ncbi:glycosyltransferase family 2 protein [Myxococcota bacterium]